MSLRVVAILALLLLACQMRCEAQVPADVRAGASAAAGAGVQPRDHERVRPGPALRDRADRSDRADRPDRAERETSDTRASVREFFQAELANVPALRDAWQNAQQVQQDRAALAREREEIARESSSDTSSQLARFHDNLAREDKLTSRLQGVMSDVMSQLPEIERQVEARRAALQAEIDAHPRGVDRPGEGPPLMRPGEGPPANESADWLLLRKKRMAVRMYESILERVPALREAPAEESALQHLLGRSAWWGVDIDPAMIAQAQRRLQRLEQEANDLRRRSELLETQLTDLRELLEAASQGGGRRGAGGGPGGPGPKPRGPGRQ